jgi:hypothetical protein
LSSGFQKRISNLSGVRLWPIGPPTVSCRLKAQRLVPGQMTQRYTVSISDLGVIDASGVRSSAARSASAPAWDAAASMLPSAEKSIDVTRSPAASNA